MQILAMTGFACGAATAAAFSCAEAWSTIIARPKTMAVTQPMLISRLCNMFSPFADAIFFANHFDGFTV
jgi:hypothetical protein